MKVYSQLEIASLENLGADPALLPLGRFFYRTDTDKFRVKLSAGVDNVVFEAATQTLINKSIAIGQITGTLPLNQGGTGQTTKVLGFNALSPLTTKGDVIVHNGTDSVRQGIGSDDQTWFADSSQTNGGAYHTLTNKNLIYNLGILTSVSSNALTIALKTAAGNNASATDPIKIGIRNATLTTGQASLLKVTGALSLVISSGSTLGHSSGNAHPIYVYLINNAGTLELAVSTVLFDESKLISTTAEGGAGAADSNAVMYSTTARSNVAFRVIAKLISTQTTAGTYAVVPTNTILGDYGSLAPTETISVSYNQPNAQAVVTGGTQIVWAAREIDTHNCMNSTTGTFTAPIDGEYTVLSSIYPNTGVAIAYSLNFNGTARATISPPAGGAAISSTIVRSYFLTAGQTITASIVGYNGNLVASAVSNTISIKRTGNLP